MLDVAGSNLTISNLTQNVGPNNVAIVWPGLQILRPLFLLLSPCGYKFSLDFTVPITSSNLAYTKPNIKRLNPNK